MIRIIIAIPEGEILYQHLLLVSRTLLTHSCPGPGCTPFLINNHSRGSKGSGTQAGLETKVSIQAHLEFFSFPEHLQAWFASSEILSVNIIQACPSSEGEGFRNFHVCFKILYMEKDLELTANLHPSRGSGRIFEEL